MSLINADVGSFVEYKYKPNYMSSYTFTDKNLKDDHTYMLVFSNSQSMQLDKFLAEATDKITILYQAPAAMNKFHGDNFNGNTLIIFEKKA